jgi:large subunit ribosomal protein L31e
MAEEKVVTINIKRQLLKAPQWERSKKAARFLRKALKKHTKAEKINIGRSINEQIWKKGAERPPIKLKVRITTKEDKENKEKKTAEVELVQKT